jgi:Ras family protein A
MCLLSMSAIDASAVSNPEQGEEVRKKIGATKYLECSAKTNDGVREVFEHATRAALLSKTGRKEGKKRVCTLL